MISSVSSNSMMSQLFSRLDTKGQGYLEKSDLATAFSNISSTSGTTSSSDTSAVDDVFAALDSDSDGKVTESEFSSTLSKLQEELDSQFNQMRMQGGMQGGGGMQGAGGMPPPPPPDGGQGQVQDSGFTQDELQSQLDEINSSGSTSSADSARADLISSVVQNFEAADTDGDGKVTFQEAQAFQDQQNSSSSSTSSSSSSSSTSSSTSSTSSASNSDAQVMHKIMELMRAYGSFGDSSSSLLSQLSGQVSVSA